MLARITLALLAAPLALCQDVSGVRTFDFPGFVRHVTLLGDHAVLGGPSHLVGDVTVWERSRPDWVQIGSLVPDATYAPTAFGGVLGAGGDRVAVAGLADVPGSGTSVVVWLYDATAGYAFEGHAHLPLDAIGTVSEAINVATDGARVILNCDGGKKTSIWARQGSTWAHEQTINDQSLGRGIGIDGDVAAIHGNNGVRTFELQGTTWVQTQVIPLASPGLSIDLQGDRLVIGRFGAVEVYARSGSSWNYVETLDEGLPLFGDEVHLDGDLLLVGARTDGNHLYEWDAGAYQLRWQMPVDPSASNLDSALSDGNIVLYEPTTAVRFGEELGAAYCDPAGMNTLGKRARVFALGSPDASEDGFELAMVDAIPGSFAIPLLSWSTASTPLGQGTLCLGNPVRLPVVSLNEEGQGHHWVDLSSGPGFTEITAQVPIDMNFQWWYRDGNQSNLSNAVTVSFH